MAGICCFGLVGLVLVLARTGAWASADSRVITSTGPLTRVEISDTLNCSVNHTADAAGEFFDNTACGTFLAVAGTVYGPPNVPAGEDMTGAPNYVGFTAVSQSQVTGSGTTADPFKIVTVVDAGNIGFRITETDTYVTGQETYRTDVSVANSGAARPIVLYRAGDCFLQDSDTGFGAVDAATGSVSCVGVSPSGDTPGTRIEQWRPLTPGSAYFESEFNEIWTAIPKAEPFPNTCRCAENIDNGAGLSWSATAPAGGSLTFSHLTSFSPAGNQPLTTTKTADSASVSAGSAAGYTITVSNPNTSAVTVNSVTDTLPAGFTYVAGSTTGITTSNPSISGQTLTWAGPFTADAAGNIQLRFRATASTTDGTFSNNAGGEAVNFAVVPTGDTAAVTVTAAGGSGALAAQVTPGAACSPEGASGVSVTGLQMVCSRTADDAQLRWRQAGLAGQVTSTTAAGTTTTTSPVVTTTTTTTTRPTTTTSTVVATTTTVPRTSMAGTGSTTQNLAMSATVLFGSGLGLVLLAGPPPARRPSRFGRWHNAALESPGFVWAGARRVRRRARRRGRWS